MQNVITVFDRANKKIGFIPNSDNCGTQPTASFY